MSAENLEKFRALVLSSVELQKPLREIADRREFIASVMALGAVNGFDFAEQDVETAMLQSRREWLERWI